MRTILLLALLLCMQMSYAQQQPSRSAAVIAFYNCENLYDTIKDKFINDNDFLPTSPKGYNTKIYKEKISHMAKVIADIGQNANEDGAAIVGLAEIENENVLNDLIKHPLLRKRNYQYVHYNSPDPRGVDVALLFNPAYFKLNTSKRYAVRLPASTKLATYSRDILWVSGILNGDTIHVYVNHWPSRVGGEQRSSPAREYAAALCKEKVDSLMSMHPNAKIFVMGDFNDDPINKSIEKVLHANGNEKKLQPNDLFNPWLAWYKKGNGTLAYQDTWGLFDQIIISPSLLQSKTGWQYHYASVFKPAYLVETSGVFKGYPKRTWDGDSYIGGYSDHFPVYIVLSTKNN